RLAIVRGSLNGHAHRTRGAGDDLGGGHLVGGVEVAHLLPTELQALRPGKLADLVLLRHAGALTDACCLLDEVAGRRGLGDEGEGAVAVDGDLDGHDGAGLAGGRRVVLLDELHDVGAVLPQRRTDWWGGGRRTGRK